MPFEFQLISSFKPHRNSSFVPLLFKTILKKFLFSIRWQLPKIKFCSCVGLKHLGHAFCIIVHNFHQSNTCGNNYLRKSLELESLQMNSEIFETIEDFINIYRVTITNISSHLTFTTAQFLLEMFQWDLLWVNLYRY